MKNIPSEKLLEIINNCNTIADVLRNLELIPKGNNYKTIKKYIKLYNIDTSHFTGKAHLKGKKRNLKCAQLKNYLIENSSLCPSQLKTRLMRENLIEYKCNDCEINSWKGQDLVLHLDHINGVNNDHRIENLRFLCPNCHSQTATYCGRNAKHLNMKKIINNKCLTCETNIGNYSKYCRSCASKLCNPPKIEWPTIEILNKLVSENGYTKTGKNLGVSGNALKKHIKVYSSKEAT